MKKSLQFLIMGSMVLVASCQKEITTTLVDDNVAGKGILAVSSRITGGDWKFTNSWIEYDNGEISEGGGDECKTDDLYRYESNGDATVVHGAFPCFSFDYADGKFANWELIKDGTELKEVYTRDFYELVGTVVVYKVEFISNHKLTISRILTEPGKTFTEFCTYTR
jgi:hypothetical protein